MSPNSFRTGAQPSRPLVNCLVDVNAADQIMQKIVELHILIEKSYKFSGFKAEKLISEFPDKG